MARLYGIIYSARFAPDGQIVCDASWDNKAIRIFTTRAGFSQTMPLDLASAHLLDICPTGELALALGGYPVFFAGTLARAPMAGGAPRQLLKDVRWADFDNKGELAIVHHLNFPRAISSDRKQVLLNDPLLGIYDIQRGEVRPTPGATAPMWPAGWSRDSLSLRVHANWAAISNPALGDQLLGMGVSPCPFHSGNFSLAIAPYKQSTIPSSIRTF